MSTSRSPHAVRRVLAAALAGLLVVALGSAAGTVAATVTAHSAQASRASESSGRPDPQLGRRACALMGRVSVRGGCSKTRCLRRGETVRRSPNAETCLVGGRDGAAYGTEVDVRTCGRLHRRWVAAVNFCASNPHRDQLVIQHAPQCRGPFTTYVVTSRTTGGRATRREAEGRYDVCVRPSAVRALRAEARRRDLTLASLVRAQTDEPTPGAPGRTVLMVGDSLTWRGTDELARLRPDWVLDGVSGRNLRALSPRLARFTATHGDPTGLVIALGTNPARGFDASELRDVVDRLPAGTPVMVVTPYRARGLNPADQVRAVDRAAEIVRDLAADRPATCVADWRSLVDHDRGLLVDGIHQVRSRESTWARLVSSTWDRCLSTLTPPSGSPIL